MPGRKKRVVASDTFSYRVGRKIQQRREAMGLSIREAARRTGGEISDNLFGLYEDGTDPGFRKMLLVCVALEVTIDEILPDDVKEAMSPGLPREERLRLAEMALANRGPLPQPAAQPAALPQAELPPTQSVALRSGVSEIQPLKRPKPAKATTSE